MSDTPKVLDIIRTAAADCDVLNNTMARNELLDAAGMVRDLLDVAHALTLATDEGDDVAQGTHYVDKDGRIRCKGSFLATIEKARAAYAKAAGATA